MREMRAIVLGLVLAGGVSMFTVPAPRAQAAADTVVYTVSYVEVPPASERTAIALLKQYRDASLAESGHVSLDLLQQIDRQGHFVLLEAWKDEQAYETHRKAASAKLIVDRLQALAVSPVDERPYKGLAVVSKVGEPAKQPVYVVAHVDTIPAPESDGPGLLKRLADDSRKDEGNLRFDVWQHTMRANHFTVIEAWRDQKALDAHAAAAHTRQYRATLAPLVGSPLDERLYKMIE